MALSNMKSQSYGYPDVHWYQTKFWRTKASLAMSAYSNFLYISLHWRMTFSRLSGRTPSQIFTWFVNNSPTADNTPDFQQRKDPTPVLLATKALMLLQQRHGLFPRILG